MGVRTETYPEYPVSWKQGRVAGWLTTLDHKRIGILYLVTSLVFLVLGGIAALLMRTQLAQANADIITRERYNELFTLHGVTMIFFVVVPLLTGFGNYLVPLMIGARDMAFPRLNALSYWLFLFGGVALYSSLFAQGGPADTGWYIYPPYSVRQEDVGIDLMILGLHIASVSSVLGAINFIVTIHRLRAAGMTWMRLPLFVWTIYTFAILLIVALASFSAALTMLLLDRQAGTHFFLPDEGGNAVLYQHMFWFFGHPEVYIMILPAMGIVSEILPVFARKPIFGYTAIVLATVGIAFYSLLVWAHHMFTVGLGLVLLGFFMVSSMIIAVPTGVKIFNWLATIWRGNIRLDTPMLFALGFIGLFTIGGLSGIFVAAVPFDFQAHDSYFIVAHMHYVLFGGTAFAVFGGFYYWWPKMFGRVLDERLGKLNFWLLFAGFNLTFFPQHLLGLQGMPRRIYTYDRGGSWEVYNLLSTIGSYIMALAVLVFIVNVVWTRRRAGTRAPNDPWLGDTLEWYTTSPPPPHNFDKVPYVTSSRPLRDLRRRIWERERV